MKILWITNIPSPYRVNFFHLLGQKCDLDVVFECKYSKERDDSWKKFKIQGYNAFFLKGIQYKTDMAFSLQIFHFLKKQYDVIVITDYSSLTGMMAIAYLRQKNIPFVIEGDGAYAGKGKGIKELIKKSLIRSAKYWFATSEEHKKYYKFYGAISSNIIEYPFTSLHKKDILSRPKSLDEKLKLRQKKGITEKYIILSVGQFIYRKGYDILLQAARSFDNEIGIYIIGGKASDKYLDFIKKNDLEHIYFLDYMKPEELKIYFQLADVFVLPTREDIWGLVINEAMSNGLPVITTNACIAGTKLINSSCGRIVERESIDGLEGAIKEVIKDEEWKRQAAEECLKIINNYTLEKMAETHIDAFKKIIQEQ